MRHVKIVPSRVTITPERFYYRQLKLFKTFLYSFHLFMLIRIINHVEFYFI